MLRKNSMVARLSPWRRPGEGDEDGSLQPAAAQRRRDFLGQEIDLVARVLRERFVLDVVVLVEELADPLAGNAQL
jgi:hypothetical protein